MLIPEISDFREWNKKINKEKLQERKVSWFYAHGRPTLKELEFQKNLSLWASVNKQVDFLSSKSPFDTDGLNKCVKRLNNMNDVIKTELHR